MFVHFLFILGFLSAAVPAGAAGGIPYRRLLGKAPVPLDEGEIGRFQSGSVGFGRFFASPHGYSAARPDGTGSAENRLQLNLVDAKAGQGGGFLGDFVLLNDRRGRFYEPSQLNYLLGLASRSGPIRVQFDREEILPIDRGGLSHRYWDVRVGTFFETGLIDAAAFAQGRPGFKPAGDKKRGGLRGELGAGFFLHNNSFPARYDNTGTAFLRYTGRVVLALAGGMTQLSAEADLLTDQGKKRTSPANMDLTFAVAIRLSSVHLRFSHESSQMLDRDGYSAFYLLDLAVPFDTH